MKTKKVPFIATALASIIIMCLMMTVALDCQKEVKPTGTVTLYTSVPTAIIEELKPENEWVQFEVPLLVSENLWKLANQNLMERGRGKGKEGKQIDA